MPFVARNVDALREQEGLVQAIELLLDDLDALLRSPVLSFGPSLFPDVENPVLDQPCVAGRRLQQREFVDERTFELCLR